jgi:hypothetical protein
MVMGTFADLTRCFDPIGTALDCDRSLEHLAGSSPPDLSALFQMRYRNASSIRRANEQRQFISEVVGLQSRVSRGRAMIAHIILSLAVTMLIGSVFSSLAD